MRDVDMQTVPYWGHFVKCGCVNVALALETVH